jgi:hypothetical protein
MASPGAPFPLIPKTTNPLNTLLIRTEARRNGQRGNRGTLALMQNN